MLYIYVCWCGRHSATSQEAMDESTASVTGNVTSTSAAITVELCVVVVLLLVFCALGVAGNVVVLAVFCRCGDQLASTVFILVLAAVDFSTCLIVVPFTVYIELVHYHVGIDFVCKFYQVCLSVWCLSDNKCTRCSILPQSSAFMGIILLVHIIFCRKKLKTYLKYCS